MVCDGQWRKKERKEKRNKQNKTKQNKTKQTNSRLHQSKTINKHRKQAKESPLDPGLTSSSRPWHKSALKKISDSKVLTFVACCFMLVVQVHVLDCYSPVEHTPPFTTHWRQQTKIIYSSISREKNNNNNNNNNKNKNKWNITNINKINMQSHINHTSHITHHTSHITHKSHINHT